MKTENWKKVRLGDFVKIRTGKLDANASSDDGKYPFFTCSIEPLKISTYSYDCECVLVAGNGDLNVKYYNGKFDAYQRTYIIESLNKNILDVKFLYTFLSLYIETLRKLSIGGVIKYIKLANLTEALIPLPSLEIQKKISKTIKKSEKIIEENKQLLEKYDLLIKSRFIEMFGDPVINERKWGKVKLDSVADIKIGPFGSLLHQEDYIIGGHALVNPSHIIDGRICADEKLTISDEKYTELFPYHLQKHDVVMGRRGEMGRCAVVDSDGMLCGTGSLIIRSKGELKPDFIQKIISFPSYKKTIEDKAIGQTMPNLNVPIVSSFEIIKPPKEVQDNYSTFVQQIDKSKFAVQKSLEKTETLYKSLMQRYFA